MTDALTILLDDYGVARTREVRPRPPTRRKRRLWGWEDGPWVAYAWWSGWNYIRVGLCVQVRPPCLDVQLPAVLLRVGRNPNSYRVELTLLERLAELQGIVGRETLDLLLLDRLLPEDSRELRHELDRLAGAESSE